MTAYFDIARTAVPKLTEEDLDRPVRDTHIDSLDLLSIRVALEKHLGTEIPDPIWYKFERIRDALDHCQSLEPIEKVRSNDRPKPTVARESLVGMPQMTPGALSENWLFRELGDLHWQLLCTGLKAAPTRIEDEMGERLYATFARIQISSPPMCTFQEDDSIRFEGDIERHGKSMFLGNITGHCQEKRIRARLLTVFSTREAIDNSRLFRSQPKTNVDEIPECPHQPEFMSEYRLLKKGLMNHYEFGDWKTPIVDSYLFEASAKVHPYYELNGVGLVYFAAYPTISDMGEAAYFNKLGRTCRWERDFHTTFRDVFFCANCNPDDEIIYRLNNSATLPSGRVALQSSLYRKSDMVLMARIFTQKVPVANLNENEGS